MFNDFLDSIYAREKFIYIDFNFFGGEPLLNIEDIHYFVNLCNVFVQKKKIRVNYHVVTNGFLLSPENIKKLVDLGVKSAQITLDGNRTMHDNQRKLKNGQGTSDIIMYNLKCALDYGMEITINVNFKEDTLNEIKDFFENDLYVFRKFITVKLNPIISTRFNNVVEENKKLGSIFIKLYKVLVDNDYNLENIERIDQGACMLRKKNSIILNTNGDISKCLFGIGDEDFTLTNIKSNGYIDIFDANNPYIRGMCLEDKCLKCAVLPMCKGGCFRKKQSTEVSKFNSVKLEQDNIRTCANFTKYQSIIESIFYKHSERG